MLLLELEELNNSELDELLTLNNSELLELVLELLDEILLELESIELLELLVLVELLEKSKVLFQEYLFNSSVGDASISVYIVVFAGNDR